MKKFDFKDALDYMESGDKVSLTINNKRRVYYKENNDFYCIPNNNEYLKYKLKNFKIDAILSNEWELV